MNKELTEQIEQSELGENLTELKANLLNKETELQNIMEENELLKADTAKRGSEDHKSYETAITDAKLAREAERDALMKLGHTSEEADKSSRRAAKVAEQLEVAQVINSEMEAKLRCLRVQSDQWRMKAAAALSPGNNGRFVEKTNSLDIQYQSIAGKLMSSPFSDDLDDENDAEGLKLYAELFDSSVMLKHGLNIDDDEVSVDLRTLRCLLLRRMLAKVFHIWQGSRRNLD